MNTPTKNKQSHISINLIRLMAVFTMLSLIVVANFRQDKASAQTLSGFRLPWANGATAEVIRKEGSYHTNQVDFSLSGDHIVRAAKPGKVVFAKYTQSSSTSNFDEYRNANMVVIEHAPNEFSWYVHLAQTSPYVTKGQFVSYGTAIGLEGNTGYIISGDGHLHFMVSSGTDINFDDLRFDNYPPDKAPWPLGIIQPSFYEKGWNDLSGTVTSQNGAPGSCDGYESPGVTLFENKDCTGRAVIYDTPRSVILTDLNNQVSSISVNRSWMLRVCQDAVTCGSITTGAYRVLYGPNVYDRTKWDLSSDYYLDPYGNVSMNDSISAIACDICASTSAQTTSQRFAGAQSVDCPLLFPTPQPGPTSPPPGSTPPPSTSGWNVKFYTAADECNSSNCNPTTTYHQRTVDGSNINVSFANGQAYNMGPTIWGSVWKQTIYFPSGTYYFHANHDDGVKVFVSDQNIIDVWGGPENNNACPGRQLGGNIPVTVIWKNTGGPASLNFWFDQNGASCSGGGGSTWNVRWYDDYNQCTEANCNPSTQFRSDNIGGQGISINFADGKVFGGGDDTWGSIWKTTLNFPSGNYVFRVDHDDGAKLFLNGSNILDVFGNSGSEQACPARYLSGNTEVTVIWRNTGGPGHLTLWWDTNESACNPNPPFQPNIWVWKGTDNQTYVATDGPNNQQVRYYTAGSTEQSITPAWTPGSSGGYQFIVPTTWESFVIVNAAPTHLDGPNLDEWFVWADGHWVGRKKLEAWVDVEEYTRLTYWNQDMVTRKPIHYRVSGTETVTNDLWYEISGGIEARLPRNADVVHVNAWITPRVSDYTHGYWQVDGDWLLRRTIEVYTDGVGTKVIYHYGLPNTEVLLGRYGQPLETRADLWQTDGTRLYFYLPPGVISFLVRGGPLPLIQPWAAGVWHQPYETSHWVEESTIWVYKYQQETLVRYMNPTENITTTIFYYVDGDLSQHQETNFWYRVIGGWEFRVPNNAVSFLVGGGPVPILTDSTSAEWFAVNDPHWTERKFIRVSMSGGDTYLDYWHHQNPKPNIRYWQNGVETVTNSLWQANGDGLRAKIPNNMESFKVDAWIVPQLLPSTAGKWEIKDRLDPWVSRPVLLLPNQVFLPLLIR